MDPTVINVYIDRLLKEVMELTKTKLLLETQISVLERINSELNGKVSEFEKAEETRRKKAAKKEDNQF